MILIAGLGNPGIEYANTRHNIGFMVIDAILDELDCEKISNTKFKGELYKKGSLLFLKPMTFMNLSGQSVSAVKNFYKIDRVIVIHDDLDLKLGRLKFKNGGSSGGHNGIKSIDTSIGINYDRIRVGIGSELKKDTIDFVLGKFSQKEQECVKKIISITKDAVLEFVNQDIDKISQKYSSKKGFCD
ncbi:peptidyl-tRNA hydrolase [Campylobacter sputorum subsp. bubulus]|uniref:Peptidyl-tRNA hydrolase n=1 Tax=Campylobacter sputorum subsp. sputorum TaxID=32024 RepID=A0A381DIR0_9BACT|nr:aminoacyl-tRNA hydrolase [Campylobacter sputorum]ASM35601.1 peptidyl-tRNA hydrolase [Campylobacter sputorum aubsp. sputorum RM3237]ASM37319.1 peptidyl-tRNA hydrolase [Campylobacter sputorum bv. faecalis CCUG 20703]ASM38984.1 peptidyl-tRNA hydrolase [Campylobacter sputorum bv. paraureolyticus LMG 11764]KAB0582667.1 aminoacyl-tRNA hydrolase [Campylobacter sputorum subsp. sputorum]MDY6120287.1 aminoacyl-tRNA hydrolase [Campylobacter sputorum]